MKISFLKVHRICICLFILSSGIFISCNNEKQSEIDLTNCHFQSQFYYYQNDYYFTDSKHGYLKRGQLAWSFLADTANSKLKGDEVIYTDSLGFNYQTQDSVLTILAVKFDEHVENSMRFYIKTDILGNYIFQSIDNYAYGKENLIFTNAE